MFNTNFTFNQILIRTGTTFLLLSYVFSLIILIDPLDNFWGWESVILIKYLPIILSFVSLVLYLSTVKWWKYFSIELVFILIFMVYITIGSILTLIESPYILGDSFIGRGICILPIIPAFILFHLKCETRYFVRSSLGFTIIAASIITLILLFRTLGYGFMYTPHIYHEEIFVTVSIGLLLVITAKKNVSWKYLIGIVFILAGILTKKNTGFLLTLSAVTIYYYFYFSDYTRSKNEIMLSRTFGFLTLILLVSLISIILMFFLYLLPSGSPGVRLNTYLTRWDMFLESPVFGEFFMGTPIIELPSLYHSLFIPSHSDLLDILAFGGGVGFILFYYPITIIIIKSFISIKHYFLYIKYDNFYLYSLSIVSGYFILMGFNPVWNQPQLATIFWVCVAYLLVKAKNVYSRS